jgi:hypothetical protein
MEPSTVQAQDHYVTFGRREGDEDFPNSLISGISTFLGAQVIPPVRERLEQAGVKAAVLGLPWEGTNTCRPARVTALGRFDEPRNIISVTMANFRSISSTH